MGCMEHTCNECEWIAINNKSHVGICPKCGGSVSSTCDEFHDRGIDEDGYVREDEE